MYHPEGYYVRRPAPPTESFSHSSTSQYTSAMSNPGPKESLCVDEDSEEARGVKRLRSLTISGDFEVQQMLDDIQPALHAITDLTRVTLLPDLVSAVAT